MLLFLYAGVIALWHAFDDRRKMAGRAGGHSGAGRRDGHHPVIHYSVEWWNTLRGLDADAAGIVPAMRSPLRWAIAGFLRAYFMTLSLMRMRNLVTDGRNAARG